MPPRSPGAPTCSPPDTTSIPQRSNLFRLSTEPCLIKGCKGITSPQWGFCKRHRDAWQASPEWNVWRACAPMLHFRTWRIARRYFILRVNAENRTAPQAPTLRYDGVLAAAIFNRSFKALRPLAT